MLNEKPTFLSKIRTVSCGDILWAFFLPTMRIDIGVINVYHPARLCLLSHPTCHRCVNPTQGSCQQQFLRFPTKFLYLMWNFANFRGGGVVEITLPFTISLKKTFVKKCCEIFIQNFQKSSHVGNFAWKFQVCDCVNWTIFGLVFFQIHCSPSFMSCRFLSFLHCFDLIQALD